MGLLRNTGLGITAIITMASAMASNLEHQTTAVGADNLPVMAAQLKARLSFPMGWSPEVKNLAAWRKAGVTKLWELTLQAPDHTPFDAQVIAEVDRGTYVARKVAFNLTADSRVLGLLLVPKGTGPFPAAVMYHDHGARFDIGKEKMIAPWGDRGAMTYDMQQALAANFFNLGSSMAGLMAQEDTRAAAFLASLPEVNPQQVAAIGFSMGALRAWQAAALSDAITETVAVNWMATTEGLMVSGNNQLRGGSAWMMIHPGLQRFLDYPDVASLAAPKPMLLLAGEQDALIPLDAVRAAHTKMGKVWGAWKAADKLETRLWPGGHVFAQDQQVFAYDWLDRQWGVKR